MSRAKHRMIRSNPSSDRSKFHHHQLLGHPMMLSRRMLAPAASAGSSRSRSLLWAPYKQAIPDVTRAPSPLPFHMQHLFLCLSQIDIYKYSFFIHLKSYLYISIFACCSCCGVDLEVGLGPFGLLDVFLCRFFFFLSFIEEIESSKIDKRVLQSITFCMIISLDLLWRD